MLQSLITISAKSDEAEGVINNFFLVFLDNKLLQ